MKETTLTAHRFVVISTIAIATGLVGCDRKGDTVPQLALPQSQTNPKTERGESYTEARSTFQTKLVRKTPAPQPAPPLKVPPDVSVVNYESQGNKLSAWVSKDALQTGAKKPAVLFLHGGFAFGDDDWEQTEPLRQAGFHVMVPLLRGENGQPGHFSLHYGEVDDCLAAGEALAKLPGVDASNLFVSGHSIGGTLAMFVALGSDRFRGAAPISGAPDLRTHLAGQREFAPFDTADPLEFDIRSPVRYARHFRCPVRSYYGDDEADFFDPDNKAMAAAAQQAGLDVQAVRLRGDHMSVVEPALQSAVNFFREQMTK